MTTPITLESIRQTVAEARKAGKALEIRGYRNQKDEVADYVVQFLHPQNGYDDLIEQSFHKLAQMRSTGRCTTFFFDLPSDVEQDDLDTYVDEKLQSWNTRMTTPADMRRTRRQTDGLVMHPDGYLTKAGASNVVVITSMRLVSKTNSTADDDPPEKWGKSVVKNFIDKKLPIGQYIGQMNLTPENIAGLRVVG